MTFCKKMKTFRPTWNWKSRALAITSVLFLVLFTVFTAFFAYLAIRQASGGLDRDSAAALFLSLTFIAAAIAWSKGMLSTKNASYSLRFQNDLLLWKEQSAGGSRDLSIILTEILGLSYEGSPGIGLRIWAATDAKAYRLGSLLSSEDAERISSLINEAITKAEQGGGADAEPAV